MRQSRSLANPKLQMAIALLHQYIPHQPQMELISAAAAALNKKNSLALILCAGCYGYGAAEKNWKKICYSCISTGVLTHLERNATFWRKNVRVTDLYTRTRAHNLLLRCLTSELHFVYLDVINTRVKYKLYSSFPYMFPSRTAQLIILKTNLFSSRFAFSYMFLFFWHNRSSAY